MVQYKFFIAVLFQRKLQQSKSCCARCCRKYTPSNDHSEIHIFFSATNYKLTGIEFSFIHFPPVKHFRKYAMCICMCIYLNANRVISYYLFHSLNFILWTLFPSTHTHPHIFARARALKWWNRSFCMDKFYGFVVKFITKYSQYKQHKMHAWTKKNHAQNKMYARVII